jgi:hypothetical protein
MKTVLDTGAARKWAEQVVLTLPICNHSFPTHLIYFVVTLCAPKSLDELKRDKELTMHKTTPEAHSPSPTN